MSEPREAGVSVVSMFAGVVIVLVLGSIVLSQTIGGNPAHPSAGARPTGTAAPAASALASVPSAATHAACVADVAAIESAVAVFESLHGALPPAGTVWATGPGGPLSGQRWPSGGPSFALAWSGTAVAVRVTQGPHAHPAIDGAAGCTGL